MIRRSLILVVGVLIAAVTAWAASSTGSTPSATTSGGGNIGSQWPTFLAWFGAGALAAYWFTERNALRVLIALIIALVATGLSGYLGLGSYWWVGALIAVVLVIRWWRPLWASCHVTWKLINNYDKYKDRIELFISDGNWSSELEALRRSIKGYRNIMATLARQPRSYKVRDVINTEIHDDGTSVMTRDTEVEAKSETVSWIYMMHGTTSSSAQGARLEPLVVTDSWGDRLEYDFIEDMDTQKRAIIFLNKAAQVGGEPQKVRTVVRRIKSWRPLVEDLRDKGTYEVSHETESVRLTIRVPTNLRIETFTVSPTVGTTMIADSKMDVTWSASGLHPDTRYEFEVRCLRK